MGTRRTKYNSRKVVHKGITYDSKKEAKRAYELEKLEKDGTITGLQRQVKFELIPAQRIDGKVVEKACNYIADFTYYFNGSYVVEDVKGILTKEFIIKRKLMLKVHGIRINIV